jgi:hypothetical protein
MTRCENNGVTEFVHPELMTPIIAIGGNCTLTKSERLKLDEDEVLYLVGMAVFDSTCCGYGGCAYAFVPGLIRKWRFRMDDAGQVVSLVQPVIDPGMQERIRQIIMARECVQQVNFL